MSRGDATTSRTRGTGGHGARRGNGGMRGRDTGRSKAVAFVEAMQQPAGLDLRDWVPSARRDWSVRALDDVRERSFKVFLPLVFVSVACSR